MGKWRSEWQTLLLAVGFLTRIPVPSDPCFSSEKLRRACCYFPLVGLLVGLFTALVWLLAQQLFGNVVVAVLLSMAAGMVLTGGFHEDGLADSADALGLGSGAGRSREQTLAIMKDSRLGSFAALALFVVLGLKATTLVALSDYRLVVPALLLGHSLSRWFALAFTVKLVNVRPDGKSAALASGLSSREWWLSGLGVLPAVIWLPPILLLWLLPLLLVGGRWACYRLQTRLGGYTGDVLGALQQLAEIAVYLVVLGVVVD